jgi:hypothetical protein
MSLLSSQTKWIIGPASQTTFNRELLLSVEAPFHIGMDEFFHQLRAMGIHETSQSLRKKFPFIPEPALPDKGFGFPVKLIGYFGPDCLH